MREKPSRLEDEAWCASAVRILASEGLEFDSPEYCMQRIREGDTMLEGECARRCGHFAWSCRIILRAAMAAVKRVAAGASLDLEEALPISPVEFETVMSNALQFAELESKSVARLLKNEALKGEEKARVGPVSELLVLVALDALDVLAQVSFDCPQFPLPEISNFERGFWKLLSAFYSLESQQKTATTARHILSPAFARLTKTMVARLERSLPLAPGGIGLAAGDGMPVRMWIWALITFFKLVGRLAALNLFLELLSDPGPAALAHLPATLPLALRAALLEGLGPGRTEFNPLFRDVFTQGVLNLLTGCGVFSQHFECMPLLERMSRDMVDFLSSLEASRPVFNLLIPDRAIYGGLCELISKFCLIRVPSNYPGGGSDADIFSRFLRLMSPDIFPFPSVHFRPTLAAFVNDGPFIARFTRMYEDAGFFTRYLTNPKPEDGRIPRPSSMLPIIYMCAPYMSHRLRDLLWQNSQRIFSGDCSLSLGKICCFALLPLDYSPAQGPNATHLKSAALLGGVLRTHFDHGSAVDSLFHTHGRVLMIVLMELLGIAGYEYDNLDRSGGRSPIENLVLNLLGLFATNPDEERGLPAQSGLATFLQQMARLILICMHEGKELLAGSLKNVRALQAAPRAAGTGPTARDRAKSAMRAARKRKDELAAELKSIRTLRLALKKIRVLQGQLRALANKLNEQLADAYYSSYIS